MRIAHVVSTFYPIIGGGENYTRRFVASLAERGHDNFVITARVTGSPYKESLGRKVTVLRFHTLFRIGFMPVFPGFIIQLLKLKPDVIHAYGPSISDDIAAFAAFLMRKPFVLTYFADFGPRSQRNPLVLLYLFFKSFFTLKIPQKIIVISQTYIQRMILRKVPRQRIRLIPPPVDTQVFRPCDKMAVRRELGLNGRQLVLFVGSLSIEHAYKRLDLLVLAFKQVCKEIEDVRLVVVGEGTLKLHYQQMCKELGLESYVSFRGFAPESSLPKYYAAADIFVLPSPTASEGFGMVLLEAMSSGCPVIATASCGGAFVVNKSCSGIVVPPWSVEKMATAIVKILSNKKLARLYGCNARKAAERYSIEVLSSELEKVYRGLTRGQ